MGGFNYGGRGDGTSWSSERGTGPEPGGGDRGNSGNHDKGGSRNKPSQQQQQLSAIQSDPVVREKLANLIKAARVINPAAIIRIASISASGTLSISVTGINVEQASTLGLSGLLTGFKYDGENVVIGDIETNIKIPGVISAAHRDATANNIISGANNAIMPPEITPRSVWARTADYFTGSNTFARKRLEKAYLYTIQTGSIPQWSKGEIRTNLQRMLNEDQIIATQKATAEAEKRASEQAVLLKTSEVITDVGIKISEHFGEQYKTVMNEISGNIRYFQGKTIRNFNDAMASLNRVIANPAIKFSQADKDALVNAWKYVDAQDIANKLGNLSRGFKVVDLLMKIEKVRQKSIIGYETGNWGPLVLEVESWVLSGMGSALALGLFSATIGSVLLSMSVPAIIVSMAGIVVAVIVGALIDDKVAEKINKLLIRPEY